MNYKEGDIIQFGSYPYYEDGRKRYINWKIIETDGKNFAVLLSCYAIDIFPYHAKLENITWEESGIRAWLNGKFYDNAFSVEEKKRIIPASLKNNDNIGEFTQEYVDNWKIWGLDASSFLGTKWHTKGGNDTSDKVWLLSLDDMKRYSGAFNTDKDRQLKPTPNVHSRYEYGNNKYAIKNGAEGNVWWWLRSPGIYQYSAATVGPAGFITANGSNVNNVYGGVRPAIKIGEKHKN